MLSYKKAEGSGVCGEKKNFNLRMPVSGGVQKRFSIPQFSLFLCLTKYVVEKIREIPRLDWLIRKDDLLPEELLQLKMTKNR